MKSDHPVLNKRLLTHLVCFFALNKRLLTHTLCAFWLTLPLPTLHKPVLNIRLLTHLVCLDSHFLSQPSANPTAPTHQQTPRWPGCCPMVQGHTPTVIIVTIQPNPTPQHPLTSRHRIDQDAVHQSKATHTHRNHCNHSRFSNHCIHSTQPNPTAPTYQQTPRWPGCCPKRVCQWSGLRGGRACWSHAASRGCTQWTAKLKIGLA